MSSPEPPERSSTHPSEPLPPSTQPERPSASPPEHDPRAGEDQYMLIAEKILGSAMIFVGFLNVLLSISGGYEINVVPIILYCAGLAIWGHATILNPTIRYLVMGLAIILGIAFYHHGEVLFWHKQLVFWGTVALVVFFMFKSSPK